MPVSPWWLQGAILTYLVGFCILGILAYLGYQQQPPIPGLVKDASGGSLMPRADILDGMNVFQRYRVMEYGTVTVGAYLGPDLPDYLHRAAQFISAPIARRIPDRVSPLNCQQYLRRRH